MVNEAQQMRSSAGRTKRQWTETATDGRATDEAVVSQKRQRVSRACDVCRIKKDRCDGARPECSTCASLGRPCTYRSNPKKRGIPTGYLRTLELLWGLVFGNIRGSEQTVLALLRSANIPAQIADVNREGEGSNGPLSTWRNSKVLKEIESLLFNLDQPEEEAARSSQTEEHGILPTGSLEWHLSPEMGQNRANSPTSSPIETLTATGQSSCPVYKNRESGTQADLPDPRLSKIPKQYPSSLKEGEEFELSLPSNALQLVNIYFSYTHCWLPIIEKHDILRTAFSYNKGNVRLSPLRPGSGDHATLWAILTLASFQWLSKKESHEPADPQSRQLGPMGLYRVARGLIQPDGGTCEIGHVQALLILTAVNIGRQKWSDAWVLVGHAIRIAINLGLDCPEGQTMKAGIHGKSKHAFLGCFVLETLIASNMKRTPFLKKVDAIRVGPVAEDGLEEWHPWQEVPGISAETSRPDLFGRGPLRALSTFNRLVSLMFVANDICCMKNEGYYSSAKFDDLERQLSDWTATLHKNHVIDIDSRTPPTPHLIGLYMCYHSVRCRAYMSFLALQGGEALRRTNPKLPIMEGLSMLSLLGETYVKAYGVSSTPPTFASLSPVTASNFLEQQKTLLGDIANGGVAQKLRQLSHQFDSIWETCPSPERPSIGRSASLAIQLPDDISVSVTEDPAAAVAPGSIPMPPSQGVPANYRSSCRDSRASAMEDTSYDDPSFNSGLLDPWTRRMPQVNTNTNQPLGLPTPASSLETPAGALDTVAESSGGLGNSIPQVTNFMSQFAPRDDAYPQLYDTQSMGANPFGNVNTYGPPRQREIPSDLDALFDELASLEGTDRTESQPLFMRNLGFAPNSGVSELYSDQIGPYLLAQRDGGP